MIDSLKIKYFFAFLFVTAIIISGNPISASAQDGEKQQRESFLKYLIENPDYNAALNDQIEKVFKMTFPSCEIVDGSKRVKPKIIVPPHFYNENSRAIKMNIDVTTMHPEYGQWVDKMIVRGCKQTTQVNFLVTAYSLKETPVIHPTLNGQTNLQVMDQSDAENAVKQELLTAKGCTDNIFVLGSIVLGYKDPNSSGMSKTDLNHGWYERWVVEACSAYHSVNLAILPDGKQRIKYAVQIMEGETNASPAPASTDPTR